MEGNGGYGTLHCHIFLPCLFNSKKIKQKRILKIFCLYEI